MLGVEPPVVRTAKTVIGAKFDHLLSPKPPDGAGRGGPANKAKAASET